ncbi:hypothetical protein [Amycolatopsis eburnea]|uniref:Uncharacterized protein n=1 Tax=Amycolatopsis eburnea TaxID=2267691 RepID=A0A3R9DID0_9PSEU|nr:hypothetical protein [Amycolatopsis eburnea]RSD16343.1 hypothetical protein EIY87_22075 [Amycolatopsis eburnea]
MNPLCTALAQTTILLRSLVGYSAESAMARLNRAPRIPAGAPGSLALTASRMTAFEPGERPVAEEIRQLPCERVVATTSCSVLVAAPMRRRRAATAAGGLVAAAAVLAVALARPDVAGSTPSGSSAAQQSVPSTTVPAGSTTRTAVDVMAASPRTVAPAAPRGAAFASPDRGRPGPDGGPGVRSGKVAGKAKDKDVGKEKRRGGR